jgi:hypothetical protein
LIAKLPPETIRNLIVEQGLGDDELSALMDYLAAHGWDKNKPVVSPETFFLSPHYMNASGELYPMVLRSLIELNEGDYNECVLTGSIGSGKSSIALFTQAYQLYVLSCLKHPQKSFGLDPSSEIVIVFQSLNAKLAKSVDYDRFRAMIGANPYFQKYFMFDRKMESEMRFPNRIIVKPVVGADTGAIGLNVIGGILDEINFMEVIDRSKKSIDGGIFDQAWSLYNSISRRRSSRFMSKAKLPGMLCLVSSKRYPGQFTDIKQEEANKELRETGKTSIYVYDKCIWDIKPDAYTGDTFPVFTGDDTRQPRVLSDSDQVSSLDRDLIINVPEEYHTEFERDIMNALRDIAGVSTLASHPFLVSFEAVSACFGTHESIFDQEETDFEHNKVSINRKTRFDRDSPRFIHIDLALRHDSAGMVMGHVPQFTKVKRSQNNFETLPVIQIDFALEIYPPKGGEIIFSRIRDLIYELSRLGINIQWVTFDSFQSADSVQILKQKGYQVGVASMDKTATAYEMTKSALYDGRVRIPEHPKLLRELQMLEWDSKKGKVDHPVRGSKDIADALAGVVYGLTNRRAVWVTHGVSSEVPKSIKMLLKQKQSKVCECN